MAWFSHRPLRVSCAAPSAPLGVWFSSEPFLAVGHRCDWSQRPSWNEKQHKSGAEEPLEDKNDTWRGKADTRMQQTRNGANLLGVVCSLDFILISLIPLWQNCLQIRLLQQTVIWKAKRDPPSLILNYKAQNACTGSLLPDTTKSLIRMHVAVDKRPCTGYYLRQSRITSLSNKIVTLKSNENKIPGVNITHQYWDTWSILMKLKRRNWLEKDQSPEATEGLTQKRTLVSEASMTVQLMCSVAAARTKRTPSAGHSIKTFRNRTHTDVQSPRTLVSALGRGASAAQTHAASTNTPANAPPWPPDRHSSL